MREIEEEEEKQTIFFPTYSFKLCIAWMDDFFLHTNQKNLQSFPYDKYWKKCCGFIYSSNENTDGTKKKEWTNLILQQQEINFR